MEAKSHYTIKKPAANIVLAKCGVEYKIENVEILVKEKGYIPGEYIRTEERLNIYKRFAMIEDHQELNELVEEVMDRFGKIPETMKKFILSVRFKIFAEQNRIQRLEEKKETFELNFIEAESQEKIDLLRENVNFRNITKKTAFEEGINKRNNMEETFITMETDKKEFINFIKNLR